MRVRRSAKLGWAVVVLGAALLPVVAGSAPAGASTISDGASSLPPVTWVDGSGRQYVVTGTSAELGKHLVVARDLASGEPDTTWGTNGQKDLTLTAPSAGLQRETIVAVDDAGVLSTTWRANCNGFTGVCDRTFARFDVDGNPVGSVTTVTSDALPRQPLPDGSFLTQAHDGTIGWWGPDGVARATTSLTTSSTFSATVDGAGRLLVGTPAEHVVRYPAGSASDLDLDLSGTCPAHSLLVVGRATTDHGFVVACGDETHPMVVQRRGPEGGLVWSTTDDRADYRGTLTGARSAYADDLDRVWVGGWGEQAPSFVPVGLVLVETFTSTGAGPVAYTRGSPHFQTYDKGPGIVDLRPGPDHHVAVADDFECCILSPQGDVPAGTVNGVLLPHAPTAPTCVPGQTLTEPTRTTIKVSWRACDLEPAWRATDTYHLVVRQIGGDVLSDQELADPGQGLNATTPLTGLPPGVGLNITITAHDATGDGPATGGHDLVLPFAGLNGFLDYQYATIAGAAMSGDEQALWLAVLHDGTDTPAQVVDFLLDHRIATTRVEPVVRLYRAFFLRQPDLGGLDHWTEKRRKGTSLGSIADAFARSSEFVRRYGTLTNRQFVTALYHNVFGRNPDASGLDHWTKRLDTHASTHGQVVLQFSESSEGIRRSAPTVQPTGATYTMLHRLPTAAELTAWGAAADPHLAAATAILASPEYATHVLA